jgi:2-C-methyl-D-erythritol 4-phosphate cytidylyltransferase
MMEEVYQRMKKYAVIVAGGAGVRMGTEVPKQFLLLNGRPVLSYTLEAFLGSDPELEIVLVVAEAHLETTRELIKELAGVGRIRLASGGDTRFHSVRNGLEKIKEGIGGGSSIGGGAAGKEDPGGMKEQAIIFVHDGVRCLVSKQLIQRCYEQAVQLGSAIPVIDCTDSVRLAEDVGSKSIDRSRVKLVQTPQTFRSDILLPAYMQDHQEAFTDEATVIEVAGHPVYLIEGERTNIKITAPEDLVLAREWLTRKEA